MARTATFTFCSTLARKLFCGTVAWCTALAWVSTYGIAEMYRKAMADPYLAFFRCPAMRVGVEQRGTGPMKKSKS